MSEASHEIKTLGELTGALNWAAGLAARGLAKGPVVLVLRRPKRSLGQNSLLWAMLSDVARDVEWYGVKLSPEDWKEIFSAGLKKQRAVPGLEGGFVVLGASTSKMDKEEFSNLIEIIRAFGAERGVRWTDGLPPSE